ncbi:unnamed protein product [Durusdinium trenchii]|uniref:Ubiquitin-like domain-containing protein n=1 Tax=Durusdinium trenchii TaxID=1381693 RepID=A0ABP0M901_9DINO
MKGFLRGFVGAEPQPESAVEESEKRSEAKAEEEVAFSVCMLSGSVLEVRCSNATESVLELRRRVEGQLKLPSSQAACRGRMRRRESVYGRRFL